MVFEGVNVNKFRRNFKVVSVNSQTTNLARFRLASSAVRIVQPGESLVTDITPAAPGGDLIVTGVPGLTSQVSTLNKFLRGFTRPFWVRDERESCGIVIHGGRGTGKTFILRRVEETNWGRAYWIKPSDKLSTLRETFKQAYASQPSVIFIDGLDKITAKDRTNRESVIDTLGEELDALSVHAHSSGALPQVVVIATCQDWMNDVPEPLQRLRRGLLRNPGGDRVMAQVLAIVLSAGLDAVLVAVELALETGPPGKVSVEHVVNVLGRLNAVPMPQTAATQLKVSTPPLANTARYDSLRADNATEEAGHDA